MARLPRSVAILAPALAALAVALPVAARIGADCAALATGPWRPVLGADARPPVPSPRPPKGRVFLDPAWGSCVVRVTEHDQEPPKGRARHDYSRRQSFNADDSRILVTAQDGSWHLYDATTLAYLRPLPGVGGAAEPQWDPEDPDRLYYLPNNGVGMKLLELDLESGTTRVAADFGDRVRRIWPDAASVMTRWEGSPSADARYWAFQVESGEWKGLGLFTWDRETDTVLATYDLARNRRTKPDHVSMSPSGRYVVVSWNDGPHRFTREFGDPLRLAARGEHSDIAIDAHGDDVYVSVDYVSSGGPVYMVNLRTGARTDLLDTYAGASATALHFSGKGYARPGWAIVSTYGDHVNERKLWLQGRGGGHQWLHRKIFAVELRARPRIVNIAFHQSAYAKYWTEPQASPNRAITRILFNSNWGTRSETDIDTFMAILPGGLPPARP